MYTSALAVTAGVLAAYGIGYQLGKHNVLNRSYLQELEQHRVFGYAKADDTVLPNIQLINYPRFKIIYSTHLKIPLAVHQLISASTVNGDAKRNDRFFEEPQVAPAFRATEAHYKKTQAYKFLNLSRGHMASAGDYYRSQKDKDATFTYANMIPQDSDNNADTWFTFQTYQRELTSKCRSVEVISGPVFEPSDKETAGLYTVEYNVLGRDGVAVPTHLYKIIKCNMGDSLSYASAFEFANKRSFDNNKKLSDFEIPLQELEKRTGLTFNLKFPKSLIDFDYSTLSMTKEDYDKQILYPRVFEATNYNQASSELRKLKSHKIATDPLILAKVEELTVHNPEFLNKKLNACDRVSKGLWMKGDLSRNGYLSDGIRQQLHKITQESLAECRDPDRLSRIEKQLSRISNPDKPTESLLRKVQSLPDYKPTAPSTQP